MRPRSQAKWDSRSGCYRARVRWRDETGKLREEERFGPAPGPLDAWAGQRRREVEADREALRVRRRLEAAGWTLPEPTAAPAPAPGPLPSLRSFGEVFLHWLPTSKAAPYTVKIYAHNLRQTIFPTALGDLPIDQITTSQVDFLRAFLEARGHNPTPILTTLSACLSHAVREGLLERNPCHKPRGVYRADSAPQKKPSARTLTRAQRQATLEALPEPKNRDTRRYRWMLRLCGWAGLRLGEARGVQPGDLDLDRGLLHVQRQLQRAVDAGGGDVERAPKYNSCRTVPLGWRVRDELAEAVKEAERLGYRYLFANRNGRVPGVGAPSTKGGLHWRAEQAQIAAGIPEPIPWRNWRSTFLTLAVEWGYPGALVEQWVGHRSGGISGLTRVGREHYLGTWDPETLDRAGLD